MHILNSFFDRIYCINLDHRTDRWETCDKLFKETNLEVTRVSPVVIGDESHCCMNNANLSLLRTHKNLIIEAKNQNLKNVLIFEDDVEFCDEVENYNGKSLEERFSSSIDFLPNNWDVFFLGSGIYTNNKSLIGGEIYKIGYGMTTHAVAINSHYYDTIIKILDSDPDIIDNTYCRLMSQNETFSFHPNLISQRPSFSDIENKHVNYTALRNFM
jgi:GR25 family glycosyltransferase involved in LPS biosynthesis